MRITNNMIANRVLQDLRLTGDRLATLEEKLASGKNIRVPSDNPVGAVTSIRLQTGLAESEQYVKNIEDASNWLEIVDSALNNATNILQRVRELTVEGANDTTPQASRDAIADEVDQLLQQMVQVANTTYGDRYIFSGYKTNQAPFSIDTTTTPPTVSAYQGDSGAILREIGRGLNIQINQAGDVVFTPVFNALAKVSNYLRTGDVKNLSADGLATLDASLDQILSARSEAGAKLNRLDISKSRLQEVQFDLTSLLSQVQDVDVAELVVKLKADEAAYQTALAAGARIIQPTLLDFLK